MGSLAELAAQFARLGSSLDKQAVRPWDSEHMAASPAFAQQLRLALATQEIHAFTATVSVMLKQPSHVLRTLAPLQRRAARANCLPRILQQRCERQPSKPSA